MLNITLSNKCGMAHLTLRNVYSSITILLTIAVEFIALVSMNSLTKFSR